MKTRFLLSHLIGGLGVLVTLVCLAGIFWLDDIDWFLYPLVAYAIVAVPLSFMVWRCARCNSWLGRRVFTPFYCSECGAALR